MYVFTCGCTLCLRPGGEHHQSIPRGPAECFLEQNRVNALDTTASVADIAGLFGCTAKKLSSFELLGQKTEVFEFMDGQRRLQVTVRNNKVVSRTFRNL